MTRILDPTLANIVAGISFGGLPVGTAKALGRTAFLLLAARSLNDVGIFTTVTAHSDGQYIASVTGKWAIAFKFEPDIGPIDLQLAKLGKSWPEKPKSTSHRRRQGRS